MSEFDLPSGGADYGFGGSDSFTLGSENVSATGSSGGASDSDRAFFGGSDTPNIIWSWNCIKHNKCSQL